MNTPVQHEDAITQMAHIQALLTQAKAAGIQFRFYPGGTLTFEPREVLRQHPSLLEELRRYREQITKHLRAIGYDDADEARHVTEFPRIYTPKPRQRENEEC